MYTRQRRSSMSPSSPRTQMRHAAAMQRLLTAIDNVSKAGGSKDKERDIKEDKSRHTKENGAAPDAVVFPPIQTKRQSVSMPPRCPRPYLRDELKKRTVGIIPDSLYFPDLGVPGQSGSFIRPNNLLEIIDQDDVYYHLWVAVSKAMLRNEKDRTRLRKMVLELFLVELGLAVMDLAPGPHHTFVDPRLETEPELVEQGKSLIARFEEKGVEKKNIVICIPASEAGVRAAKTLAGCGIRTNLLLVSGLIHAAVCADAGASAITLPIGQILSWHETKRNKPYKDLSPHPGIEDIQAAVAYIKHHGLKTAVIGADFRQLEDIQPLACLNVACLSRSELEDLKYARLALDPELGEDSPSNMRARQAQYPPTSSKSENFLSTMSAATRSATVAILHTGISMMRQQIGLIEEKIAEIVDTRVTIAEMDIGELLEDKKAKEGERRKRRPSGVIFPGSTEVLHSPGEVLQDNETF